jgi:hypothetical protein
MLDQRIARSGKLSDVSFAAECIWYRILPHVDDAGNLPADVEELRATIIPLGKKGKQVSFKHLEGYIAELEHVGLIQRYQADSKPFLHFSRFLDFQTLRKDRGLTIEWPEPPDDIPVTTTGLPPATSDNPVVYRDMLARARELNGTELNLKKDAREPDDCGNVDNPECAQVHEGEIKDPKMRAALARLAGDAIKPAMSPQEIAEIQDQTAAERRRV